MSSNNQPHEPKKLKELLPHGAQKAIAEKVGLSRQAVSDALTEGRAGHPAVIEAMRIARESGALNTAQDLATL